MGQTFNQAPSLIDKCKKIGKNIGLFVEYLSAFDPDATEYYVEHPYFEHDEAKVISNLELERRVAAGKAIVDGWEAAGLNLE